MTTIEVTPNSKPEQPQEVPVDQPSFLRDHFSVVVVAVIFTLLLAVYVMEIHWSANDTVLLWLQNKMDTVLGAILMGLTGTAAALARGSGK